MVTDSDMCDDTIIKATADYYERRLKNRDKDRRLDIWIAIGLYLVLSSVALVAL